MFNAASYSFGTRIYADQPHQPYHAVSNLIMDDQEMSPTNGFLCGPLIQPPVNVIICFPRPVTPKLVVVKPFLRRHRVSRLALYTRGRQVPRGSSPAASMEPSEHFKSVSVCYKYSQLASSICLDHYNHNTIVALRSAGYDVVPPGSCLSTARCLYQLENQRDSSCLIILIRILRMATKSSIPCLGAVEVWCEAPMEIEQRILPKQHNSKIEKDSQDRSSSAPNECNQPNATIPSQFVDILTGDLMIDPVRLPSGNRIDRSTLERFERERLAIAPNEHRLVDPFTMVPFEPEELVLDESLKRSISEYKTKCSRLDELCAELEARDRIPRISVRPSVAVLDTSSDEADVEL